MIKINHIGFNWMHGDGFFINKAHGDNDYLFLLFRSRASVILGTESIVVNPPAVFIYGKGHKQKFGYADETFVNDWIHFDSDEPDREEKEIDVLLKKLDIPTQTPIYINDAQTISDLIRDLQNEYHQPNPFREGLIDAKIRTLFHKLACICYQEKSVPAYRNKYRKEFTNIRNQIYQTYGAENIQTLAKQLNMSVSYFQRIYKDLFKTPPGQDIIKSRLSYACILLRYENITLANISERCHYSNVEHFVRQFKKYMNCTPGEYRNFAFHPKS